MVHFYKVSFIFRFLFPRPDEFYLASTHRIRSSNNVYSRMGVLNEVDRLSGKEEVRGFLHWHGRRRGMHAIRDTLEVLIFTPESSSGSNIDLRRR